MSNPRAFSLWMPRTLMQTLTRMKKVLTEDYHHMTRMDENVNCMKLTHLLLNFPLNLRAPFCTTTFYFKVLIAFLNVHNRDNNTFLLCKLCMLISRIIPILTFRLVHTWYEEYSHHASALHDSQLLAKWDNLWSYPMAQSVCGIGSAH